MSLSHIENRRDPTDFGADLNVLLGDITINGDLTVNGLINGNSAQGQNTNNVFTGTNEWSVYRPETNSTTGVGFSGVNLTQANANVVTDNVCNQGATWTGSNTFTQPVNTIQSPYVTPVGQEAVIGATLYSDANTLNESYLTSANTWTNTNTFQVLPICLDPVLGPEIATKSYVDVTTLTVQPDTVTVKGQNTLTQTFSDLAIQAMLIGGGGGSTSGTSTSTLGWAGGAGATASILVLNQAIGGAPLASLSFVSGAGGNSGQGTAPPQAYSTNGSATQLSLTPLNGSGLAPFAPTPILSVAGGSGNLGFAGDTSTGVSLGGIYTNTLPVVQPLCFANGGSGQLGGNQARQSSGVDAFGWGGSATSLSGQNGNQGGYSFTRF